jgi:two-component system sensor histidine kinase KdpD
MRAVAGIALTTGIGLAGFDRIGLADIAMLYVVAIMIAATRGRGPAIVASSLAVAAYDFCFITPRFTFQVAEPTHLVTFGVMFGAGLAISELTARLRRRDQEARDAALRAHTEELRSSLLSAVSHDLRTPLAVITGAATSLRDEPTLPEASRTDLIATIAEEAQRLERVLGNLLGMTRLETGVVPAREVVPVEELVGGALGRLDDLVAGRPVAVDVPPELEVSVDPVLFEQALVNLIENAVKHGAPPIEIRARGAERSVELELSDHGPGLAPGTEAMVFDKFFRGPHPRAPGVGLGLAVTRGIVEAHGGTVVAGANPAGGARFVVSVPS